MSQENSLLTIADMKRGDLMARIDNEIQLCAKDIFARDKVTGPRKVTVNITLKEESGMIQISLDTSHSIPKAPSSMAIGYLNKQGKLVAQGDAEDIMKQPTLAEVKKFKTGTDGK